MFVSMGTIGNVLVVVWRLAQKRDQRTSLLSILIIMLAVSDFLYCVHLLLLETLVAESYQGQKKTLGQISSTSGHVCIASGCLSFFSCFIAQWATFNIADYSFDAVTEWSSRSCCSLVRKRNLLIIITFQVLVVIAVTYFAALAYYDYTKVWDYNNFTSPIEQTQVYIRCAWIQSNGLSYCRSSTGSAKESIFGKCKFSHWIVSYFGGLIAISNTIITLGCVVFYIVLCLTLRRQAFIANVTQESDRHKLQWRLSVIVLLNALCWIPVTVLHWTSIIDVSKSWSNDSTTANILLISISPVVNPLIYTFAGKSFSHSIRRYWRRIKCYLSPRRNSSNYNDVHRDEDDWNTEDTSVWSSEQSRLLPSVNDSREAT
ncbi:uncharacterized protein LOC134198365 [Corticium candelabrum]|uniref:uncharacterized protein LOC134198365 n=1 Tax=Corticium candelabrum TaxID=121492 RepID=UPI002E2642E2|nr:uncharacterized protein LOC134198365 [Corticium candelabrum]